VIAAEDDGYLLPLGYPLNPHLPAHSDLFTLPPCGNAGCSEDTGGAAVDLILQGFSPTSCGHNAESYCKSLIRSESADHQSGSNNSQTFLRCSWRFSPHASQPEETSGLWLRRGGRGADLADQEGFRLGGPQWVDDVSLMSCPQMLHSCLPGPTTLSDYPRNRHPGWSRGSVAYHADDGKVFHGSGVGDAFGPRCLKGDIMGCGIMFPRDYILDEEGDVDDWDRLEVRQGRAGVQNVLYLDDEERRKRKTAKRASKRPGRSRG
ncbi:hypothetical protein KUCAC02_012414, partial [Chaenocephalus aceratus]